jgi:hypothetical protein
MRPPRGRGALHELEPLRKEHAHEGTQRDRRQAVDRIPVHTQVLGLAGLKADLDAVLPVVVSEVEHHPRHALTAAANQLPLVGGARRARRAAEVERLEEIRLARTIRARDDGEPLRELHLRALVVAEVAQLDARDPHDAPTRSV